MFTVSSHEPFLIPNQYKNKFKEQKEPIQKTIEYTDYSLNQFFKSAKKEKWFDNTIFVFVADHCNTIVNDEFYNQK
jgi:phosphoglycerol transferase MdoB-like AlkP superfamily enzyme